MKKILLLLIIIAISNDCYSKSSNVRYAKLIDSSIYPGLKFERYKYGTKKNQFIANVLKLDIKNSNLSLEILKANNLNNSLAKITDILYYHDSLDNKQSIAAINGNFWRAYSNYPVGILIKNGRVIEFKSHKEWSSIFFDENNLPYIDNFKIDCIIEINKNKYFVSDFNKRNDSNQIIIYNSYAGENIPSLNLEDVQKTYQQLLFEQAILETFSDSTENELNYNDLLEVAKNNELSKNLELNIKKILLRRITDEKINKPIKFIVEKIDTGVFNINENYYVLSPGYNQLFFDYPNINDTLSLTLKTNILQDKVFLNAISSTPRLVRNGTPSNEAKNEGVRSKRFINNKLSRTAFGMDKNKNFIFLVTIPSKHLNNQSNGANLNQLARFMKDIGCFNALNLDGGGSSIMVINGYNVDNKEITNLTRRLSSAISIRIKRGEK